MSYKERGVKMRLIDEELEKRIVARDKRIEEHFGKTEIFHVALCVILTLIGLIILFK